MDCIAVGDSIAVGVGQAAQCVLNAKVGASSGYIADHVVSINKKIAIISAGSNDPSNPKLRKNLEKIRTKIRSEKVVWILPYNRKAAKIVKSVAFANGDGVIDLASYKSNDGVHPFSYKAVAKQVK